MAASLAFHDLPYTELLGAPKGRRRTAQGVSPGNTNSNNVSPERAKQLVSVLKSNSASPFQGSAICTLNPGLTPWAVLLDPFGVLIGVPFGTVTLFPVNLTPIGTILPEIS